MVCCQCVCGRKKENKKSHKSQRGAAVRWNMVLPILNRKKIENQYVANTIDIVVTYYKYIKVREKLIWYQWTVFQIVSYTSVYISATVLGFTDCGWLENFNILSNSTVLLLKWIWNSDRFKLRFQDEEIVPFTKHWNRMVANWVKLWPSVSYQSS